ncbi:MAG: hypothetical protein ACR2HN_03465 [Tepidiformaceae bacterium]
MAAELPAHVVSQRRDGRKEVLLHRSVAIIGPEKIEIRSARSTVVVPLLGLALVVAAGTWMAWAGGALPFWLLVGLLLFCLAVAPLAVMSLVSSVAGAEVVVDARKGSITWQQGYLGMGLGTKELVPFAKIDRLEVTIEGDQPDRWRGESDALRQFALVLVKQSGRRLTMTQVPVPAYGQADGMDRTLAVGSAIGALCGASVTLPEGWELVEIHVATGEPPAARGSGRAGEGASADGQEPPLT